MGLAIVCADSFGYQILLWVDIRVVLVDFYTLERLVALEYFSSLFLYFHCYCSSLIFCLCFLHVSI